MPAIIDRRSFLRGALATAGLGAFRPARAPGAPAILIQDTDRPATPQGVASGDVGGGRAVIWSRADRPARMFVEFATTERFENARRVPGPAAIDTSDFTARVVLRDLPDGQRIFYRVLFQDLSDIRRWSQPAAGSFRTPPSARQPRNVTLAFSADTVGQGWGLNPDWGGLKMYETMLRGDPDIFVHLGDTIYADNPVVAEVKLDDGTIWKNLVTPAKSKVAETLEEYRGNYQYNLLDEHMRRFNAQVPQIVIWDDHEVQNNWYWERSLEKDDRYRVKSAALLAARGRRAFLEYNPLPVGVDDPDRIYRSIGYGPPVDVFAIDLRSYRGPNSENRQPTLDEQSALAGAGQIEWLKAGLAASRATWKVVACDMPIGLVVRDGPLYEAVGNADDGAPLGRELEMAGLLRFIRDRRIRNVVWITGDVHYCAAHYYDPSRATFTEFAPFWEFVAGPLHAGTFGPNALDATFGPEVKFNGVARGMKGNRPPSDGFQFFGTLTVDARTRVLTAKLLNLAGQTLYSVDLPAER
jgi:alkaline phosphatase D